MSVGPRQFHETLRVFVVGKNYRLQNIQLSKIRPGELVPRNFAGRRDSLPRTPSLAHSRGPKAPLRSLACLRNICLRRLGWCAARARLAHARVDRAGAHNRCRRRCVRGSSPSLTHRNFSKSNQRKFAVPLVWDEGWLANRSSFILARGPPSRFALRWATFAFIHERRLVENTGLEPVTSWLQTRRSPS